MKLLISLCFACVCLSASAVFAQTTSQCTTSELDLVCAPGQFLRGINPETEQKFVKPRRPQA